MADWLLIRLPRTPEQPATWLTVDPRGNPSGPPQSGPLSLAAPRSAGRRICVLVPGTDVLVAEPELPTKAGTKSLQLVPYALEEQLADDIDDLHFAIGRRPPDSTRTPVAVVTRALLEEDVVVVRPPSGSPVTLPADALQEALEMAQSTSPEGGGSGRGLILYT